MKMIQFKTPYPRPTKLSNKECCYSNEELNGILKKHDSELVCSDFRVLFAVSNCTGEYNELVYFLPYFLLYLVNTSDDCLDCIDEIACFIGNNKNNLMKDDIFHKCEDALEICFHNWTSIFNVVYYDKQDCEKKQWVLEYDDIVDNSQLVCEFLDHLCTHGLKNVAIRCIQIISSDQATDIQSAWFLEYTYQTKKKYEYYSDKNYDERKNNFQQSMNDFLSSQMYNEFKETFKGERKDMVSDKIDDILSKTTNEMVDFEKINSINMIPTKEIPEIFSILSDQNRINFHYNKISKTIILNEKLPTYWKDVKKYLIK